MKVVALAGGVGGAKLADGLAQVLAAESLTIIVNTGDDFQHLGLQICPDLDTVCYTLAGLANPATGWGRAGESWNALESLALLGGPTWFRLGDRDLGTHLERTRLLRAGLPLSEITARFCRAWGVGPSVLPMSNDQVSTWVDTEEGELSFQEYFVRRQCRPRVRGFRFLGADTARPAPGVLIALDEADLVIFCPSNPWVSIDPILAVPGIRQALADGGGPDRPVLAVSPIVRGAAIKGPAAKMYAELGLQSSALSVANHYGLKFSGGCLTSFVLDIQDRDQQTPIEATGLSALATNTLMKSRADRKRLAGKVLQFATGQSF